MAMAIKNNMAAQSALGELKKNNDKLGKDLKKVSTGMKINGAGDDASGYSISERMRVQLRGLNQDNQNAQNATSLLKTADGAISSTVDLLKTMKEKAINAANDTNTDTDRATIQKEINQSIDQLEDNANVTFNNKTLFDGSADVATDVKQTIVKALNSEWIDSSLQLIKDSYGIAFIRNFSNLAQADHLYIAEGAAEYTHGIDDFRKASFKSMTANTIDSTNNDDAYVGGYSFLHYLNAKSGHDGHSMKRLMSTLVAKGATQDGIDSAIAAASKGAFATEAEAKAAYKADFAKAGSATAFLKNYCDIDLENMRDTGSATGSKSWNGEEANGKQVVLEGMSTRYWWYPSARQTTIEGLTMDWGDYPKPDLTDAGFRFQVGTKANQNIFASFSDIHANALGCAMTTAISSASRPVPTRSAR